MTDQIEEQEDREEDDDDDELVAVHRRYLPEAVNVIDALEALESAGIPVATFLDIGAGGAATALLVLIQRDFERVWAVSDEIPEYNIWRDADVWLKIIGKTADIKYIEANIFERPKMRKHLGEQKFDVGYLCHTLHHLRTSKCQWEQPGGRGKRVCGNPPEGKPVPCSYQDCDRAVGEFRPDVVFDTLARYCSTILVSEDFYADKDIDKAGAQGGILNAAERLDLLTHLLRRTGSIRFFTPEEETVESEEELDALLKTLEMSPHWMFSATMAKGGRQAG